MSFSFAEWLSCPICAGKVQSTETGLQCTSCNAEYFQTDSIPWFYQDAPQKLNEWRAKMRYFLEHHGASAHKAESAEKKVKLKSSEKRMQKTAEGHQKLCNQVNQLLKELQIPKPESKGFSEGLGTKIPSNQGLYSYYANLHRDWFWGEEENSKSLSLCVESLKASSCGDMTGKKMAVLGSGGSKLAYDLHLSLGLSKSLAIDINPLLLTAAKNIISGNQIELTEFPLAPKSIDQIAIPRVLKTEPSLNNNDFGFLFADAVSPLIQKGSIDLLFTPWFTDIVPRDLKELLPVYNQSLEMGGIWVQFGSLVFTHADVKRRYMVEELEELIDIHGFELLDKRTTTIPYMDCPDSFHGRSEEVLCFVAKKVKDSKPAKHFRYMPEWLEKKHAIPRTSHMQQITLKHTIFAEALSLVDGKRNLNDIAKIFGQRHKMSPEQAYASLLGFFMQVYEESQMQGM